MKCIKAWKTIVTGKRKSIRASRNQTGSRGGGRYGKMNTERIEINEQFEKALDLIEHGSKNIFITGKAGTGKSTLLNYFRNNTKKKAAFLAPTGVAAVN